MEWNSFKRIQPNYSGQYLVSILKPGELILGTFFCYIACFDIDSSQWYKYDPFSDDDKKEIITFEVTGWMDLPAPLLNG